MTTTIKKFIYFLCLGTLFESCLVVGIGNSSSWDNKTEVALKSLTADSLKVEIDFFRPNSMIPIPFFFVVLDKKKYSLTFYLETKQKKYLTLDSLKYSIKTLTDMELVNGKCESTNKFFRQLRQGDKTYFQSWADSNPNIKISKNNQSEDLKVISYLYLTNLDSTKTILEKTSKLTLYKPKTVTIGWFEI